MSDPSRILAAILLIAVPTVELGGLALLSMLSRRTAGYVDNPLRQSMFRAGQRTLGCGGVRSGRLAVGGPDGPKGAVEVDCPDRVRGGTDSHAARLLRFGDPARRAAAQRCHRIGVVAGLALGVGAVTLRLGLLLSG
jgi:hypothetical protein